MRCIVLLLFLFAASARGLAQTPLTLEVATDREFYLDSAVHKVYAAITLGTGPASTQSPASSSKLSSSSSFSSLSSSKPLAPGAVGRNVAFVFDRSGSMAGERMQALRTGLGAALSRLGGRDIVSVVLFGSEVETLVEARPRETLANLDALLAAAEPSGGSALYDALNQGAAQLRRNAGPAASNELILVTDGPPTKGPRELADFVRLAAAFAEERITVSAIGLGDEFNEDMLAALARAGNGQLRYAAQPATLVEALPATLAAPGPLVARDVTVTVELLADSRELKSYGWIPATIAGHTAVYRVPYVFSGQKIPLFLGAEMEARRFSYRFARFKLAWTSVLDGARHELENVVTVRLETDPAVSPSSANPAVIRTAVGLTLSEGLQQAIEQIDKADFRRALRALRSARSDAYALNFKVDDREADALIRRFEKFLDEVQARGLNPSDRKMLRSGLLNQLPLPVAEDPVQP